MGWPGAAGAEPPTREVRTVPTGRVKTDPTGHPLPPHRPRGVVSLHPSLLSVHLLSRRADVSRNETQRRSRSFCPLRVFLPSVPGDRVRFALARPRLFEAAEDAEPPRGGPGSWKLDDWGDAATQWWRWELPYVGLNQRA